MIYISSACVKAKTIKESVKKLVKLGFKNIELSGGTKYYSKIEEDLIELKQEYDLNFLCHNYFPPPKSPFVLNLASLNKEVSQKSLNHCIEAIDLSTKLGATKYAFHAGFLFDIPLKQIGKEISNNDFFNKKDAYEEFQTNLMELSHYAGEKVDLYIENNVISAGNYERFEQENPFFFTHLDGLKKINLPDNTKPLIDLAHLKVSCNTLNLNFENELRELVPKTDYIHISDNDGINDQNRGLIENSSLFQSLKGTNLKNKTITLETYDGDDNLVKSYNLILKLIS